MRKPFYSRIRGKKILLDRGILADLQMTVGSVLYAVELNNRNQSEWVLSPIPPEIWDEAYELTAFLAKEPGTLADAARVLADLKVSIFASTVSPISADGEVCWTAVAQIPSENKLDQASLDQMSFDLKQRLYGSQEDETGPTKIHLEPMKALRHFSQVRQRHYFSGKIADSSLHLDKFFAENGESMMAHLSRYFGRSQRAGTPSFCLLSVESEEKYIKMTFPPVRADLYELSMDVNISSDKNDDFRGVFASVTQALGVAQASIYASQNYMLEKKAGSHGWTEEARFSFTIDLSNADDFLPSAIGETENAFYEKIQSSLESAVEDREGGRRMELPRERFWIIKKESHKPRCFLATNATNKDRAYHEYVKKTIDMLRDLGLEPVNVDITKLATVREDATNVLRSCAFLVSLHLPTMSVKVEPSSLDVELGETNKDFAPSDWVMFEESFMMAQSRRVFRLRHKEVRRPRYGVGEFDYPFESGGTFDARLARLRTLLSEYTTTLDYQKRLQECVAFVEQLDIINIDRELYAAYGLDV